MKKVCLGIAVALLLCMTAATALAEGEKPSASALTAKDTPTADSQKPTPTPGKESAPPEREPAQASASLAIDSLHVYDGMDKAYMAGYTPRVKGGTATVVLPLIAQGALQGNTITVTPNLGDPSSAPFVFKNYQKTVRLASNTVGGGGKAASYLVRFDLPLKSGRLNGVYPVTIAIEARAADGSPVQQAFTCYVTIADGKDPNAAQPTPKPEKPTSQPKIIVSSCRVDPSPVTAGKDFTATITLRNTSETKAVQNMKITAACDSPNFTLLNDSNTIFIEKLGRGATTDIELKYRVDLKTAAQQYNIALAIEYDNDQAATLTSAGTVPVSVEQPLRVQMEAPKMEAQVNAGDTLPLTFQVMNLGRGMVYNVRCELSAPGLIPSGAAFLGNMEAGTSKTGQMDVFIGTKDMSAGHEGDEKYGPTSGTVTLIYEDETGREYTAKTEFSTTIHEPVVAAATTAPQAEPKKAGQWWVSILVAGVVILGLAAYLVYRGRRGRKHESN